MAVEESSPLSTLRGLQKLQYRGYDSFGILLWNRGENSVLLCKEKGELSAEIMESLLQKKSNIELGHTRWATHGKSSRENAHPHFDTKQEFFVVMNGIVENADEVRTELQSEGVVFVSETDTEIIPQLYAYYYEEDSSLSLLQLTEKVLERLFGEFSFILKFGHEILAYKHSNPLLVGKKDSEWYLCSDASDIQSKCSEYFLLEDKQIFHLNMEADFVRSALYDKDMRKLEIKFRVSKVQEGEEEKSQEYYMEKEMLEQKHLRKLLTEENKKEIQRIAESLQKKPVYLLGAGSSYHATLYLHYKLLERGIVSQCILASELENYSQIKDSLLLVFSQSGETADLLHPLKTLKEKNELVAITNAPDSSIDCMAEQRIHLHCGKEISVASTKAFLFQSYVAELLTQELEGKELGFELDDFERDFALVFSENEGKIEELVEKLAEKKSFFFLGKRQYYPLACEAALKLKEISYIHAEGYAGGELKHGPLALIESGVPVVILGDENAILSNAIEVKTRGGFLIGIGKKESSYFDCFLRVPEHHSEQYTVMLSQMLAFKMAVHKGINPDKPRNLAKSVTVK
ncbi:glutamine--fructose-6-phosphate transaminase (isomerizing) [Candidatus Woesearchaeota archaeon]|nr:glutamine--fructose-6-phosphate transaminase (isomerizing) [Nanoarchaeota archaeon]MCB9370607.1 glutamine--fructose-6-phosphate transaminase (isomerizing) [Candidatus Woesearchaeota archaeon]USN43688.1 MAG: glutamine--fructose-6-phosphate transaminase (isomerizing) [Candidatus Woesearchaeota archaeon]